MEQENPSPETPFHQDPNAQQPSQALFYQNPSHIEATDMVIEQLGSEEFANTNISQLRKACQFKKALSLLEAEFDSKRASLGDFDVKLVPLLTQMAEVQIALAEYLKASDLCQRSDKILQASQEDPDYNTLMAHTCQIMALISRENQTYKEALDLINNSLALSSPDSLQNIEKYRIKALILCDLQQYKEALQEMQRSLDIVDKSTNTIDNIERARVYNTSGYIHSTIHDWKKAARAYVIAMEICRKSDLSLHIEMAKAHEGFGSFLIETNKSSPTVLSVTESALKIYDNCFGEDRHPARISSFLLLARYFKQKKESSKAKDYIMLAVEEGEAFYGSDCEKIREVRLSAARVVGNRQLKEYLVSPIMETSTEHKNGRELLNLFLQKFDACLLCGGYQVFSFLFLEALNAIKNMYGERSLEMVKIYERMVIFYQGTKQLKKMIEYLGRIIDIYKEFFGENHIEIAKAYLTFSGIYSAQKKFSQAIPYLEQALKIQVEFYGEAHLAVAETYTLLANAYGFAGEQSKSMRTHLKVLRIQEKIGDEKIYETYESMGMLYAKMNDAKSSGSCFRKSYQVARAKLGIRDERTLDTKEFSEFNAEEKDMLENTQDVFE